VTPRGGMVPSHRGAEGAELGEPWPRELRRAERKGAGRTSRSWAPWERGCHGRRGRLQAGGEQEGEWCGGGRV
jgi:hypothetical protein